MPRLATTAHTDRRWRIHELTPTDREAAREPANRTVRTVMHTGGRR